MGWNWWLQALPVRGALCASAAATAAAAPAAAAVAASRAPARPRPDAAPPRPRTGSTVKGCAQYCENMATIVLSVMLALVRSVAVHSIRMFLISGAMRECQPLMTGGRERSVPAESKLRGARADGGGEAGEPWA